MFGFKFLGNTHIPHHKKTTESSPVKMPILREVVLPMSQHIGAPATPIVKVGDEVKVGQLIAKPEGYVSAAIHSPVSGKVTKIEDYTLYNGKTVPAIRIESDGLMTVSDEIAPPKVVDGESFIEAIKASGLVGLGGAGFPTAVKLGGAQKGAIHTVVVNVAECEPYITCDTITVMEQQDAICNGIDLLEKYIPSIQNIVFGIEANKPQCIAKVKEYFKGNSKVSVVTLPSLYPQGAEKVLIYNTTKKVVPEGKLPADIGVLVINVTTLAVLANYIKTGMPLVEKCITVDGSAVNDPKNIIVPVGTTIRDVLAFMGVDIENVGKVLFGGPMMGVAAYSFDQPVEKRTNALTVLSVQDCVEYEAAACIHCGRCVYACPMQLNPTIFSKALTMGKEEKMVVLEENRINLCMECGCCSYVCPAGRPLVANNRLAKAELREHKAHLSTLK
ncbi:MAG: electron transport complex subunit RsxC [Clostridia bacterium]|nr:electron transport complex subunit RsxC [Clostridia bacterium]